MSNANLLNVLITGGSGYLGSAFTNYCQQQGWSVTWVSRDQHTSHPSGVSVIDYQQLASSQTPFDVVINLAGAGVADARWSPQRKQQLCDSRLKPTQALLDYFEQVDTKPKLFISGSAIGWYGTQSVEDTSVLIETSQPVQSDFAHLLCQQWEALADQANQWQIPTVIIRTGIVLSADGGMITRLKLPFSLGLGGRLADGKQIMSWISLRDWVNAVGFIIHHHIDDNHSDNLDSPTLAHNGHPTIYNLTAPDPVSNQVFTKAVGKWLNRPTVFAQPKALLQLIFGEMSTLLINGQKVSPEALLTAGFEFKDIEIGQAFG